MDAAVHDSDPNARPIQAIVGVSIACAAAAGGELVALADAAVIGQVRNKGQRGQFAQIFVRNAQGKGVDQRQAAGDVRAQRGHLRLLGGRQSAVDLDDDRRKAGRFVRRQRPADGQVGSGRSRSSLRSACGEGQRRAGKQAGRKGARRFVKFFHRVLLLRNRRSWQPGGLALVSLGP